MIRIYADDDCEEPLLIHEGLLDVYSRYYRACFEGGISENHQKGFTLGLSRQDLQTVITYLYTGHSHLPWITRSLCISGRTLSICSHSADLS